MTTIRVLRILEYTYKTPERMEADMGHWAMGINAIRSVGMNGMSIRSATLPPHILPNDDQGVHEALGDAITNVQMGEKPYVTNGYLLSLVQELKNLGFEIVPRLT